MDPKKKYGVLGAAGISLVAVMATLPGSASASPPSPFTEGSSPAANPRVGIQDNGLISSLDESPVAWGQLPLTNPDTTAGFDRYGYRSLTPGQPLTQAPDEGNKTEPDKNVYLIFQGKHYLYQGHEIGGRGYITRVNLDEADTAKRVTLIAEAPGDSSTPPKGPTFDGITWDPWTHQLLVTAESSAPVGGVFAVGLDASGNATSPTATRIPAMGSGGYEGIQNDSDGNVWIVEDVGGKAPAGHPNSKVPNSYVYRFTPTTRGDLSTGTLQALQVLRKDGTPATAPQLQATGADPFIDQLHTDGASFRTRWVTIDPADSTAGAATAGATPFKRPENGVFRPGTGFGEFYFTETGDTNKDSDLPGAFGGVLRLSQSGPSAATGTISPVTVGDVYHTGFDNISFATKDQLLVVEDAGDGLHGQRNALDSGYVIQLDGNHGSRQLTRWLAEGRDSSATWDALFPHNPANDGDNEVSGIHVSNGDPSIGGILGAQVPTPFTKGWRAFWTQQHGDNVTWELTSVSTRGNH
ncbi:MAG: phosphatase-like protein [Blastococcus sp.]|nr:phosphatase-like protein [Blastococcus sp.]